MKRESCVCFVSSLKETVKTSVCPSAKQQGSFQWKRGLPLNSELSDRIAINAANQSVCSTLSPSGGRWFIFSLYLFSVCLQVLGLFFAECVWAHRPSTRFKHNLGGESLPSPTHALSIRTSFKYTHTHTHTHTHTTNAPSLEKKNKTMQDSKYIIAGWILQTHVQQQ